ncbi:MAG: hypothetical protein K6E27_12365 [Eubacterium sp.]|nr:hypothetical protein [Eubacterium sp.]
MDEIKTQQKIIKSHEAYESFIRHYWRYYKELESEILSTRRYVDFDEGNFTSFSVEYLKLYQAVCSEIDVLGKAIAESIDKNFKPNEKQNNIYKWWLIIQDELKFPTWNDEKMEWDYVDLDKAEVDFFSYIPMKPWDNFETEVRPNKKGVIRTELVKGKRVPSWWSDYNKVKHHRTSRISNSNRINYTKANLGNLAKSISALYVLEYSFMHSVGTKTDIEAFADNSELFTKIAFTTSEDMERMFDFDVLDEY